MNLYVKFNGGKSTPIEVQGADTIRSVIERAFAKGNFTYELPGDERLRVDRGSTRIKDLTKTVADHDLQRDATLDVKILPSKESCYDEALISQLQKFLRICAGELGPGEITFISVGGHVENNATESIKRQQCPDALLNYCLKNSVDLNIILIDPDFATLSMTHRQIYDDAGWVLHEVESDGKIRQYMYAPATTASACDIWLTVFAMMLPEYNNDLQGQGKIIGRIPLPNMFAALDTGKHGGSCLICGNFFPDPPKKSQYFTKGPREVVEAAGFIYSE